MTTIITGIYEKGIIRPLRRLPFREHQKVELKIEIPTLAKRTKAIIHVHSKVAKLIAASHKFTVLEN